MPKRRSARAAASSSWEMAAAGLMRRQFSGEIRVQSRHSTTATGDVAARQARPHTTTRQALYCPGTALTGQGVDLAATRRPGVARWPAFAAGLLLLFCADAGA